MKLFKKKKIAINTETGEVKPFDPKDYDKEKYEIIDVDKLIVERVDYKISHRPEEDTWSRELGMKPLSKVVNELSKDYVPKKRIAEYRIINDEILEVDNTCYNYFFLPFGLAFAIITFWSSRVNRRVG